METLARKTQLCADGHKVLMIPKENMYISVPSRDLVRTFSLLAVLNGPEILPADIQNTYSMAPLTENTIQLLIRKVVFQNTWWLVDRVKLSELYVDCQ